MRVEGLEVVKSGKRLKTIGQPLNFIRKKCNEIAVQCGGMEAKALSCVLQTAGSEHHQYSTKRVFTYVVGGQVKMNDTCYFSILFARYVET